MAAFGCPFDPPLPTFGWAHPLSPAARTVPLPRPQQPAMWPTTWRRARLEAKLGSKTAGPAVVNSCGSTWSWPVCERNNSINMHCIYIIHRSYKICSVQEEYIYSTRVLHIYTSVYPQIISRRWEGKNDQQLQRLPTMSGPPKHKTKRSLCTIMGRSFFDDVLLDCIKYLPKIVMMFIEIPDDMGWSWCQLVLATLTSRGSNNISQELTESLANASHC